MRKFKVEEQYPGQRHFWLLWAMTFLYIGYIISLVPDSWLLGILIGSPFVAIGAAFFAAFIHVWKTSKNQKRENFTKGRKNETRAEK